MKTRLLKSLKLRSDPRRGVALLLCVGFALFAFTLVAAQLSSQRRVTALQLGDAAEGSRVTIVSDSALNDYEAFRSGDRFYVKIPVADFTSTVPHFRAPGLESVQVQKVGDSLVISFKLQPGATARVDSRGNRLEVIFSANRGSANAASPANRDTVGPMPPGSVAAASRDRVVTDRAAAGNENRAAQNPWVPTSQHNDLNKGSKRTARDQSTGSNPAVTSPSPRSSPSSLLTPGTSATYLPLKGGTPAVAPTPRPGGSASSSGGIQNWKSRSAAALQWAATNRLATLLGALILLSLILYLAMALRSRQKGDVKAKRAKAPKVQPKYSADGQLAELSGPSLDEPSGHQMKNDPAPARSASEVVSDGARPNRVQEQPDIRESQPVAALTAAAEISHNNERGLTKPTIALPTGGPDEYSSEEDREVFEL